ncbi:hypothetical protein Trydic_g3594 [Trypoxylus dichotomus]
MTQSMFNCNISKLRCDNAGEYTSKQFVDYCKRNGIILDYAVSYTPERNDKAELMNRTLVKRSHAMISESDVPKEFWGEAIRTVAHVINRAITGSVKDMTPLEIWYKRKCGSFDSTSFVENVPEDYDEVKYRLDEEYWSSAVRRELNSMEENDTLEKVEIPKGDKTLDIK